VGERFDKIFAVFRFVMGVFRFCEGGMPETKKSAKPEGAISLGVALSNLDTLSY
jgi:hypothetical protein